jgi:hypothetical protein
MAFPANLSSSVISDIIATSIQQRSGVLADNVTNNNALLMTLKKRGNIRPFNGGDSILEEIMYNDATTINAQSYSGYEPVNITVNSPISAAQFQIKQYAASVSMSGLEMLQNAGKEKIIDLLDGRMKVAEAQLMNLITNDLFLDGTGNGGRAITGLAAALPITTNAGTYGGIDRGTWSFWRPVSFRGVSDGGAAVSSANIQQYMNRIAVQLVRNTDRPDVIFDRLFRAETPEQVTARKEDAGRRGSILDLVDASAKRLNSKLGTNDCRSSTNTSPPSGSSSSRCRPTSSGWPSRGRRSSRSTLASRRPSIPTPAGPTPSTMATTSG